MRFDRALLELGLWCGRVEAVFGRAALLRPDGDGPRLTLLEEGPRRLVPLGVELAGPLRLEPGQPAALRGRRLSVGALSVELEGDGVSLVLEAGPVGRVDLEDVPGRARDLLDTRRSVDPLTAAVRTGLDRLVRAIATGDETAIGAAVRRLSGVGPGSTPTGDDLLTGVAAALRRRAHPSGAALDRAMAALPDGGTTPVAREMLVHAARGTFPEPLLELARASGTPVALVSIGAQTGCDLLAGLLAGLGADAPQRSRRA